MKVLLLLIFATQWAVKAQDNSNQILFFAGTYPELLQEAKRTGKPVFIEFGANWCRPCQQLRQETFSDKNIVAYVNENYIPYQIDVDLFSGMDIADKFKVKEYPTIVFISGKAKYIDRIKGFFPPKFFLAELAKRATKKTFWGSEKVLSKL